MSIIGDDRGQSVQIGFILLFSILVIMLTIYQATYIPNLNQKVEFTHSQAVQDDMLDLRNEILDSKQTGERGYAEVKLGTDYPARIIGVNPPPASGVLETGSPEEINVTADGTVPNLCPSDGPIMTRNVTYTAGYAEYSDPPQIVYENTVLYLKFDNETTLLTDEVLVQGSSISLSPLNTSFRESGVNSVSVEPIPGNKRTAELDNATISLPTDLSEEKWETLLAEDDIDAGNITVQDGRLILHTSGSLGVACSPTGLSEAPPGGQREAAGLGINPAGPNDIEVRAFNRPSNDVVEVTFNNTANTDANVSQARLSFYSNQQDTGGELGPINLIDQDGTTVLSMELLAAEKALDPEIRFPGNNTESVITFENTGGEKFAQEDFFVVRFVYDNGREGTYFIDVPA